MAENGTTHSQCGLVHFCCFGGCTHSRVLPTSLLLGGSGSFPSFRAEILQDQKWVALILMSEEESAESDAMEEMAVEAGGIMPSLGLLDLDGQVHNYGDFEGRPL